MGIFKRKQRDNRAALWAWDPEAANLSGEQSWALLTNGIYFRSVAPRLDTLGGGLEDLDWLQGLATWWEVRNESEYKELVTWMQHEGHRAQWAADAVDDGDEKFAWDFCRLITLSGGAALADVITPTQGWDMVLHAADELSKRFDSWDDLAANYLSGRIL